MKIPYEILKVKEEADDAQIKKAYLGMVRRYPPERFPDDFQRIYREDMIDQIKAIDSAMAKDDNELIQEHMDELSEIIFYLES